MPDEMMPEIFQAAHALQRGIARKISLRQQSLLRASHLHSAGDISQFKIVQNGLGNIERKFVGIPNFFMDNKTDIDAEGFAGIRHGGSIADAVRLQPHARFFDPQ
jgi:hypothetical protein